jgi:hypothetical protein
MEEISLITYGQQFLIKIESRSLHLHACLYDSN